jgi:hypothetical protein
VKKMYHQPNKPNVNVKPAGITKQFTGIPENQKKTINPPDESRSTKRSQLVMIEDEDEDDYYYRQLNDGDRYFYHQFACACDLCWYGWDDDEYDD